MAADPALTDARPSSNRWARPSWIGGAVLIVLVLIALVVYVSVQRAIVGLRIRFADEQTAIFEEMRKQLEKADDPLEGVKFLEGALTYYPSGTKQIEGSPLDRIVERARRIAVREMIELLREKTGQEFGDDPQRWIEGLSEP